MIGSIRNGMKPLLCVGENTKERTEGKTARKISMQINNAFKGLQAEQAKEVVVAYEPLWAIGSGQAATAKDAQEVCHLIREKLTTMFGEKISRQVRILYGGSVKADNAAEIAQCPNVNGVLVGGASLDATSFTQIIQAFAQI